MSDDDESRGRSKPLRPERPSLENAMFVLLGMIATVLVLVHLYTLFTG